MKIEFIHIPKCAGTSIRKALDTMTTGHFPVRKSPHNPDFRFTFIRNPFDRIASLYRHMNKRDIAGTGEWSFEKWFNITVVKDNTDIWNSKYWNPCYWWLINENEEIDLDFIGKVEQIEKDWQKLCKKLNKTIILERHNKSKNRNQSYTPEMIDVMHQRYKNDFEIWYSNLK